MLNKSASLSTQDHVLDMVALDLVVKTQVDHVVMLASTPGRIFAFTSDLAKIRPGVDCMLENMPPSLINKLMKFH